ncbi:GlsB/YeaQ/YmgE family stress response membrane protein [Nocardia cyriacigeorgica]|uniref:GlsB/YeaQ/YmgE family stress response membrane protein n=1 Tax=Nocardia cyriacigeorgica TaxID=135487 RepID=UPI0013D5D5FD|nr:GlsB/YeaQ/YmgE family stress response membrane protein [Nocardia cyriacigeorgica]MBF6439477.1 GlsB/YeaQ/YmgE family stress response membrane protein [Nocardia cyriacigeorgica]MBF6455737.1 GlsB/YeaQ/YmgE family stress response membrane protein [Nocardia cyriacigeorgica]MBF6479820.1 GlsB/YeaQ/YmgE family stress response membrane protein [Nocardia cyriacigeorgica]MBF6553521.1 GlsB/YeaQ/YmgE family stress response membrane protein [Nocardia cyriacigeorgica]NEW28848.1 GlsB/YeaQ/YmgE family stres
MLGTIIGAIIVGLFVGAVARLVMPGKQNIGVIMTILLGVIGSFAGSWIAYQAGYSNSNGGFQIIPLVVGIVVAVVLIALYLAVTGRRVR